VDWEAAFQNDRYADLAVVANMLVANEAENRSIFKTASINLILLLAPQAGNEADL
jgi:thiamine kinase-like enzyme